MVDIKNSAVLPTGVTNKNYFIGQYTDREGYNETIEKLKLVSEIFYAAVPTIPTEQEVYILDEPQDKNIIYNVHNYIKVLESAHLAGHLKKLPATDWTLVLGMQSTTYDERSQLSMSRLFQQLFKYLLEYPTYKYMLEYPWKWTQKQFDENWEKKAMRDYTGKKDMIKRYEHLIRIVETQYVENQEKKVSIIDFGGELGEAYLVLASYFDDKIKIDYHVVETEQLTQKGNLFYKLAGFEDIKFYQDSSSIPLENIDIITAYASIGYAPDWKLEMQKLLDFRPKHFIINRAHLTEEKSFLTRQVLQRDESYPLWFINQEEFIATFQDLYTPTNQETAILGEAQWEFIGYPDQINTDALRVMTDFVFERV